MPRYLVERTFPGGLVAPAVPEVVERNADQGVTWIHSYLSDDGKKMFCVCDAPTPEAITKTAVGNGLPVDRITHVLVLDPYFYPREQQ